MAGLYHTLNIGSESLAATRQGVDTAGHNIANAQVEGYSRQRVNLKQREPLQVRGTLIGNGAYVGSVSRAHDKFIERQLTKANQDAGRVRARAEGLKAIELVFSPELSASIADETTKFFNGLENLSNFPEDVVIRTALVESAKDLAASFRRVDTELKAQRAGLNEKIQYLTADLTDKLREIADLNIRIQTSEVGEGMLANDLRDQRDRLLREVSTEIEVHYYEDQHGMLMLRGPSQVTLVDGGHSAVVGVERNLENDGLFDVTITDWEGHVQRNVTRKVDGGSLQAMIDLRDHDLPRLIEHNNRMAYELVTSVNDVHRQGYGLRDYAEHTGRDFFRQPLDMHSAAASFEIDDAILQSHDAIAAASSPSAPGDNVNLNRLIKLKDAKLFGDARVSFNEYYANYAGALGLDVVRAAHMVEASDITVQDLTNRREAVSGVSLDEEATNIMKWQANFTASSKVITTVDEMLETVLSLKR